MMIFSKIVISLLCLLLLFSIFIANLLSAIATDHTLYIEDKGFGENHTKRLEQKYEQIGNTMGNLIWFLQISDIHISIFRDPGRIAQFQQFCDGTVKKIKPAIVVATGDLTDAKAKDNLGSSQIKSEWIYYHNIIKESDLQKDIVWLDIRGNHDNFNIKGINSNENYFRNFSVQGRDNPKSYIHYHNHNGINVAFLGVDACPEPGLRRPFNFIGLLDRKEQQCIEKLKLKANVNADHIVWFGHYPTSCILSLKQNSESISVRQLIGTSPNSLAYLCGHLHTMGGFVSRMYTKQKEGFLEIELGDWKDNRMYRLAAIDHGMFSFVDQEHNKWPLVLITNPKHARYLLPGREPIKLIHSSSHIRMLAFSDVDIESVKISYDQIKWSECNHVDGPLYVHQWLPSDYLTGIHRLYVQVVDEMGKETTIDHIFSLENSLDDFEFLPRVFLMLKAEATFQAIFGTLLMLNIVPLVVVRFQKRPPKIPKGMGVNKLIRNIWLLSKINIVFYCIILYAIYLPFGPWAIGELIDGYVGVIFAWGIVIKGVYLPEPFTYMYGSVQLMFVQIPLTIVLANCLFTQLYSPNQVGYRRLIRNLPFILVLTVQMLLAYFFWLEYGTMSFLFGPLRSWSIIMSIILWCRVMNLAPEQTSKLRRMNAIV